MMSFSLPETSADCKAAFQDADSAARWLTAQSHADTSALLDALVNEIRAFNAVATRAGKRFQTLEVLRETVFSVSREGLRRFENRAQPLTPSEQAVFDMARQLWRSCTEAYLHCLQACLDLDKEVSGQAARVAHRTLTCLRMEQLCCYLAGNDVDGPFWGKLHAAYAAAEYLGVHVESVEDMLPRETADSTSSGQYSMALLLYLVNPSTLTPSQFAATVRWLTRWRELATVQRLPETKAESCSIALDLSLEQPLHDFQQAAAEARWLVIDRVLKKMRKRVEALHAGDSPQNLKLGNTLPSEDCIALLETLCDRLRFSPSSFASLPAGVVLERVASGLDKIYRLLGDLNDILAKRDEGLHHQNRQRADDYSVEPETADPIRPAGNVRALPRRR